MSESTRLCRARGKLLAVAIIAIAMLAMPSLASAAARSPIVRGTTTLTLNHHLVRKLKRADITLALVKPSKFKGTHKVAFSVAGGEIEPTTGAGTIAHRGGLKVRRGRNSVTLKGLTLSTTSRSLSAKVGGKTIKLATIAGTSVAHLGFDTSITATNLKLTATGARALDTITPDQGGKARPFFRANMTIGSTTTEVEPETVNVEAREDLVFDADPTLLGKLAGVGVALEPLYPTTAAGNVFSTTISGGTISPFGTSGTVESSGGVRLIQNLAGGPSTTITLGSFGVELGPRTATAEVTGESNAELEGRRPLNLGNLPRSSAADLTITGITPSPATRSVVVTATASLQPVAAEVLEAFVRVYQGYYAQGAAKEAAAKATKEGKPISEAEAQKIGAKAAEEKVAADQIKAGESLGSFSFTAIGE